VTVCAGRARSASHTMHQSAEQRRLAAFEEGLARLSAAVDGGAARERSWLERLRAGLVAFLAFFDDEPGWGRLLVCYAPPSGAARALRCEQRVLGVLTSLLDDGGPLVIGELAPEPQLIAELLAGGVVAVIRKRLLEHDERSFVELAPALMAFIIEPYLGETAARAELAGRSAPAGDEALEEAVGRGAVEHTPVELPVLLTPRTLLALRAIEAAPRSSNRGVAELAGLRDEGQTSKLLGRLKQRGLIENVGAGAARGEANAWLLTGRGRFVLGLTGGMPHAAPPARRGAAWRGDAAGGGGAK
jgi:hypothetical protein